MGMYYTDGVRVYSKSEKLEPADKAGNLFKELVPSRSIFVVGLIGLNVLGLSAIIYGASALATMASLGLVVGLNFRKSGTEISTPKVPVRSIWLSAGMQLAGVLFGIVLVKFVLDQTSLAGGFGL